MPTFGPSCYVHLCKVTVNTNDVEINWPHYYSKLYPFTTEQWFSLGFNAINYDLWVHEDHQTILGNYHNCWIVYHTQSMPLQWILLGGLGVYVWPTHEVDMRLLFPISVRLVALSTHSNELGLLWTKWLPGRNTNLVLSEKYQYLLECLAALVTMLVMCYTVRMSGRFHCEPTFLGTQTVGLL